MKTEIWKRIIGYEGYYEISNLGRVKFLKRIVKGKVIFPEKICKVHLGKRGYFVTDLNVNGVRKTVLIHRLIAIHFIPNPKNKKYVNLGVGWDKYAGKWKSQIYFKGKSIHIGSFSDEHSAYMARVEFERKNGIENKYL